MEMDKTDLEEGEAYPPYPDDDRNVDPDEAFSYIDERIQDVLGHYLKDFEGGFSAESLGARFGGYGSFLPAHRRSPSIVSNLKTPQEVGSHSIPRPLHNRPSEGAHKNSTILMSEALHVRHEPDSDGALPPLVSRSSMDSSDMPFNPSNHKMLKVRIKMGSESILALKNAQIYSGLGLDMSSSSSLEESTALCKGNLAESRETLGESPSWIIKMMTSFPFPDGVLLSPLEDSLVHMVEEENYPKNTRSGTVQEISAIIANEFAPEKGNIKVFQKKKLKLQDKTRSSVEMINESCEDPVNVIDTHLNQEIDIQNSIDKEIVSSALKLQLTSDEKNEVLNVVEGTGSTSKGKMDVPKHRIGTSIIGKEGALELLSDEQANGAHPRGNAKTGLFGKVCEDKRAGLDVRDSGAKVDSSSVSSKVDNDIPKIVKVLAGGTTQPARQKFDQKAPSHLQDRMKIYHGKENPSSEGKKKLKGSQSNGRLTAESPKESLMSGSSKAPKDKNACNSYFPPKGEGNDVKSYQDLRKARYDLSYFGGKMKLGKNGAKLSKIGDAEKEMNAFSGKSKERSGGKKPNSLSTFDAPLKVDLNDTALMENGPNLNVFPTEAAPVVIEENWVACDKCHKWRLLPYGTNPDHLPKKWLCSMLNWLPGMNKCSFSEDETTNALNALYQVPTSDIPINQLSYPNRVESDVTLASGQHFDPIPQEVGFNAVPGGGKKKQGSRAVSDADDAEPLKMKGKREADQDGFEVHKKARKMSKHYTDVVQNPGGSTKQTRIDDQKDNKCFASHYSQAKDGSLASKEKQKKHAEKIVTMEECGKKEISSKKRKLKDFQGTQINSATPLSKHQIERKSSELNYQENAFDRSKEIHGSKVSISTSTLDARSCLRKDLGSGQPFVATTSSSSKVSTTCKIKVSLRKVKGSPVESVTSSPLRISNPDNLSKSLLGLDDASSASFSIINSQRRGSGGNFDDGSDPSETIRKEKDRNPMESLKYNVESNPPDCTPYKEEMDSVKNKTQADYNIKSENVQRSYVGRKFFPGKDLNNCRKRGYQSESEKRKDPYAKSDTKWQDGKSTAEKNHENERSAKDTSCHAANNALKEAKDLKHSANRLKISGSGLRSTELFFQAALKFLHGALLLEHCNTDTANYGEMTSMQAYGTTAKLCEYCAHEFERCNDMASAALAYKCVEVSYMRLIYSNDLIASKDRHELQMSLQMVPSVESPSSCASDVDNLNYQAIMDKANVPKGVDLPQLTVDHIVAARNQPRFVRLLNFAQDVNFAMEASRKSQDAFAAASVVLAEAGNSEGISYVKRVLDFCFHDLEGLLDLVHHTMEVLNS